MEPFRFFEAASEDPFGPKSVDFERLGPLFAECGFTLAKRTNLRLGRPFFAQQIFEIGSWGPWRGPSRDFEGSPGALLAQKGSEGVSAF